MWDRGLDQAKAFVSQVSAQLQVNLSQAKEMTEAVSLSDVLQGVISKQQLDPQVGVCVRERDEEKSPANCCSKKPLLPLPTSVHRLMAPACCTVCQELRLLGFHKANMEFANAASLSSLSHDHWDQGDKYAFGGAHCVIKVGREGGATLSSLLMLCLSRLTASPFAAEQEGFGAGVCEALRLQLDEDQFQLSTQVTRIDYGSQHGHCRVWTDKQQVLECDQVRHPLRTSSTTLWESAWP